jgi:hypothetical protein
MKYFQAFLTALIHDWISLMSGLAGVALTIVSVFGPVSLQGPFFWIAALACLLVAAYRVWLAEYKARERLLGERAPDLEFVRDASSKPYLEEFDLGSGAKDRYLRIGVRNKGAVSADTVRLVLEGCEPKSSAAVHLEHEVQPMGKPAGTLSVSIPSQGLAVFDVAHEIIQSGDDTGELHFSYASRPGGALPSIGEGYRIILRAEGGYRIVQWQGTLGGRVPGRLASAKDSDTAPR